jgi:hypothetical protein
MIRVVGEFFSSVLAGPEAQSRLQWLKPAPSP